jgi:signal transduction histidine kinase/ligand-binding sensor domain-containing protein/DNA-binding response OmpR family regulator
MTVSRIILLVGVLAFTELHAQLDEIQFNRIPGPNGERLGKITGITEDNKGYMWFSGQEEKCIYRYDGSRFLVFRHDNLNPNSLGSSDIETIFADNKGLVWIGFNGAGLDQFNPATGLFTHYRNDARNPKSLSNNNVSVILRDRRGRLWVGTENGLNQLDEKTGTFIRYSHDPDKPGSISNNVVRALYEDRNGILWIGTGAPFNRIDPGLGGLNRMEPDGTFTSFLSNPTDEHTLINNKIRSIFEDSRGVFWVGTSGDGLHTLDRNTGRFVRHRYDPAHPEKLSRPPLQKDDWRNYNDQVTFIREDQYGHIWIGSMWSGINRYDPSTQTVTHYENNSGFDDRSGWMAHLSHDGALWISTQENNLYRVDMIPGVVRYTPLIRESEAHRFLEDGDGNLWIATQDGVIKSSSHGTVLKKIDVATPDLQGISNNTIALLQDEPNTLWVGTSKQIGTIDVRTLTYQPFAPDTLGDIGLVITILKDHANQLWFATREGLLSYDRQKNATRWHLTDTASPYQGNSQEAVSLYEDASHTLWVGTWARGVIRLNEDAKETGHYLGDSKISYLMGDSQGIIWAGTQIGLYRYDPATNRFAKFTTGSALDKDNIFGIIEDRNHDLWVTTQTSITKIDSSRTESVTYKNRSDVYSIPGAIYQSPRGEILVGHGFGYFSFYPEDFQRMVQPLKIRITDIFVNSRPIDLLNTPDSTHLFNREDIDALSLRFDQNNVSLHFSVDDFRASQSTKFLTRLEGYDNQWRETPSSLGVNYLNVPPGTYTFRIKAKTIFGSLAEKSIRIDISPPWMKTWWAYVSYGFVLAGILFVARRNIVRQERLKARLQVEQMEREKEHLELTKVREIDRARTSFFTNISHEFRTPLTLIQGPVQALKKDFANHPAALTRLTLIENNSNLLLRLINQLLELSRLESGKVHVDRTEIDLHHFLSSINGAFHSHAELRQIQLVVEEPIEHFAVVTDLGKVETILFNLIGNALKFTPTQGRIRFSTQLEKKPEPYLTFVVADTGIGISKENQSRIFERFFQVSDAHQEMGTGIGLSLVKELVQLLEGTIQVDSEPGRGSMFTVTIPIAAYHILAVVAVESATTPAPLLPDEENDPEKNALPRILVVEDNRSLREFIIDSFDHQFQFLEAENGKKGFDIAIREVPELIISDVMMPEMDGMTMTRQLRADIRTSHIPIILLTAKVATDSKLKGLSLGADDYLTKPFNQQELVLKVSNSIAARTRLREKMRSELMTKSDPVAVLSADEKFLLKVKTIIHERMSEAALGVEFLAHEVGLSRVQLYRKVNALTGITVNELIRNFRLQRAAQLLEQQWGPVSQVAYEVGIHNLSYFSKCFKEQYGVSPSEYPTKGHSAGATV